jgi:hypothetical protein
MIRAIQLVVACVVVLFGTAGQVLAIDLLVASPFSDEILQYDDTGTFVGAFVTAGSGGLDVPVTPIFGPDGNL